MESVARVNAPLGSALVGWGASRQEIRRLLQCARCAELSVGGDYQYTCAIGHVICDSCGSEMASCCYVDPSSGSLCRQIIARLKITFAQKKMIEICCKTLTPKTLTPKLPKVDEVKQKESDKESPVLPVESIKSCEKDEEEGFCPPKDDVSCLKNSKSSAPLLQTPNQSEELADVVDDIIPRSLYPGENPGLASDWDEMHQESGITVSLEDHEDSSDSTSVSTCDSSPEEEQHDVPAPAETEFAKDESSNPDSLEYEENMIRLDIQHLEQQLEVVGGWSSEERKKEMDKMEEVCRGMSRDEWRIWYRRHLTNILEARFRESRTSKFKRTFMYS